MLPKTGKIGGKPSEENPEERKLNRPLHRQYEAAKAIALAGYKIINNPNLNERDRLSGLEPRKTPDYRIEGLIFDCYTPDPPVVANARAKEYVRQFVEPPNEDPWDWDDLLPADEIRDHAQKLVLESIRSQIGKKIFERQTFNIVLNLSDVLPLVTLREVGEMLEHRRVDGLQYVLAVEPKNGALARGELTEQISGTFVLYTGGPPREVKQMHTYSLSDGGQMTVAEIHSPGV